MSANETLICRDCKKPFDFPEHEQRFFAERGWTPPKRCIPCRRENKANRLKQDQQRS